MTFHVAYSLLTFGHPPVSELERSGPARGNRAGSVF